ncbi:hypothetical protein MHU86_22242 [Fragilaria crotonensis]|nr:hypothetical protein MHU86_22242 [Fragilaria crotonensis]
MSEPPPSLPHTGKTKKASRTGGTNVSKKLLMEFQSLIAFACYDLPSIAGGGVAMTEPVMEKLMMKLCFGDNDDDDICLLCRSISSWTEQVQRIVCICWAWWKVSFCS